MASPSSPDFSTASDFSTDKDWSSDRHSSMSPSPPPTADHFKEGVREAGGAGGMEGKTKDRRNEGWLDEVLSVVMPLIGSKGDEK